MSQHDPERGAAIDPPQGAAPPSDEQVARSAKSATRARGYDGHWWWGVGRRKSAVARVRIRPGDGKFIINKRPSAEYFTEERDQKDIVAALAKTKTVGSLDVHVNVRGGGFTGQAGAILLGLGRALIRYDASLSGVLRDSGMLTRDPREVERKKFGQAGARRRFQFSKR